MKIKIEDPLHIGQVNRENKNVERHDALKHIEGKKKLENKYHDKYEDDEIEETREEIARLEEELKNVEHDLFINDDVKRENERYRLENEIEKLQEKLKNLIEGEDD
ncbi:MAG: hypothetical protein WC459_01115 [Patescibacteria group bacterium]